jgi:hypothetical protein
MTSIHVVRNDFPGIAGRFDQGVSDALDLAVLTCIEVADPLTRVDLGFLKGNKTIERGAEHREITWNQEYAAHQNSGTVYMSGTHFADIGADAGMERLQSELRGLF